MLYGIHRIKGLFGTPVLALVVQGWHEGLTQGYLDPFENPINWDDEAIYATHNDGEIVGVLCWAHQEWNKVAVIRFGYVKPEYRRQGIYGFLHADFMDAAKEKKVLRISSATFIRNIPVRGAALKRGDFEHKVTLEHDL